MSTPLNLERNSGLPSQGTHLFKIIKAEEQLSKSGEPMWVLSCQCQDAGEDQGKQFPMFLSLTPQARFKVDEFLDAIEAPRKGTLMVEDCVGKLFRIAVVYSEYEGTVRAAAGRMFPKSSTENPPTPMDSTKSRLPTDSVEEPRRKIF